MLLTPRISRMTQHESHGLVQCATVRSHVQPARSTNGHPDACSPREENASFQIAVGNGIEERTVE